MKTLILLLTMAVVSARAKDVSKDWLDGVCARLPANEAALVQRAQRTLFDNIVVKPAWSPRRGIEPSASHYHGVWNWDSAFHTLATSHWDEQLTREQFDIVFSMQQTNGEIPCFISDEGKINAGNPQWDQSQPPVMTWAVAVADRRHPDDEYLREVYPKLVKLGGFWCNERGGDRDGLFFYASKHIGYESGWDNSFRWDGGYLLSPSDDHRLWAIDLNCYMVSHYRALAYIADRLHLAKDRQHWIAEADRLAKRINKKLWDEKLGFYVDCDRVSGKTIKTMTPAGFMPLFVHIAPPDRAARLAKIAATPEKFFPGMPCVAYDTPGYNSRDYWRGPTWINISYFALKGLKDYGYGAMAEQIRATLLDWMTIEKSSLHEYYDSRTGAGLGAQTYGWTGSFAIAFILDWDNDNLTWIFQKCPVSSSLFK
jgi:putative isomerase